MFINQNTCCIRRARDAKKRNPPHRSTLTDWNRPQEASGQSEANSRPMPTGSPVGRNPKEDP